MQAIVTSNLTKKYGELAAVDNLNLSVAKGELFSLLGVNGAGKTTTIKMLSCLIAPTSGDAVILGDSITARPQAVKKKINISPQETAVAENLSVRENLELIAGLYGQNAAAAKAGAGRMAEQFGFNDILKKKAKKLSGGMQRRLSIALALITSPEILFLDEPTLGLDVLARRELWHLIKGLKGKVTIILTTHYLEEAEALSDHVGVMAKGKLSAVGTPVELMAQTGTAKLEDAFIVLNGGLL
ncbi:MAG: ABC transporter ATP-binding protein [Firmicutes bacterium]|nr:ABC transporter ATP-binding protein [Bacillota bacterium]